MSITVEGAAQLERSGRAAAVELGRTADMHREIATLIAGRVNAPRRTGLLQSSIRPSSTDTEALVGSSLVYAPVQEYGWARHNIRARRYLAAAFEQSTDDAQRIVADHVAAAVSGIHGR